MTAAQWLVANDPRRMLAFLVDTASSRELRLFASACYRRVWGDLSDERSRKAVEAAERFADARTNSERQQLRTARKGAMAAEMASGRASAARAARFAVARSHLVAARQAASYAFAARWAFGSHEGIIESIAQAHLLREVLGPLPFGEYPFNPRWRNSTTAALCEHIYAERQFADLPILADALEDTGCTDAAILDHCRQPGEHVRGCWVVDLVLGKK